MDLVLNPRVRIRCDGDTLCVQTPNSELGLQTFTVSQQRERALFDTILSILGAAEPAVDLDEVIWHRLGELGVVIPADDAASDLTFACELPRASRPADPAARIAHPALAIQRGPELPPAVTALLRGGLLPLAPRFPIAWISDPVTGVSVPYSVSGRHAAALERLVAGAPAPDDLPDDVRDDLAAVEILVDPAFAARREADWEARLRMAHRSFSVRGWAIVRGLLPAAYLAALRGYVRGYIADGYARRGDSHVPLRWGCHNQHFVTLLHGGLDQLVSRVTGCPTKASYSYFASYMPGAVLSRHRDRAQCKYSISLQLDASPDGGDPWPLQFEDLRGEPCAARLAPGDGLFYLGCDLTHWRDALPAGRSSTSAFLHYVDRDFSGVLS